MLTPVTQAELPWPNQRVFQQNVLLIKVEQTSNKDGFIASQLPDSPTINQRAISSARISSEQLAKDQRVDSNHQESQQLSLPLPMTVVSLFLMPMQFFTNERTDDVFCNALPGLHDRPWR